MVNFNPQISLFINNQEFIFWTRIKVRRRSKSISSLEVTIPNRLGQFTSKFAKDQPVQLFATWGTGASPFWSGNVDSIRRNAERHGDIQLWCRDPVRIYEAERTVDDLFNPYYQFTGNYLGLMQDMNSKVSAPLSLAASLSSTDFEIFKEYSNRKTLQEFIDAATYGGYDWFFSGVQEKLVIREPRELTDQNKVRTFILGDPNDFASVDLTNFAFLLSDSVSTDYSDTYNRIFASGPSTSGLSYIFPPEMPQKPREQVLQNDAWVTQNSLIQVATNYYNDHRFGRTSVSIGLLHGQEGMEVGDIIFCDDAFYGLSLLPTKLFRIIEIDDTFTKAGWNSQFQLGDFKPTLADFL